MQPSEYPQILQAHMARGLTLPQAQKEIFKTHPGLRRRFEQSQKSGGASASASDVSGVPAHVVSTIREIEASKSNGGAASPDDCGYTPITDETKRIALGFSRKGWAVRQAKQGTAPAVSGSEPSRDYFELIREVKVRRGCDFATAAREVNRTHPRAWAEMLSKANGGMDFSDRIKGR